MFLWFLGMSSHNRVMYIKQKTIRAVCRCTLVFVSQIMKECDTILRTFPSNPTLNLLFLSGLLQDGFQSRIKVIEIRYLCLSQLEQVWSQMKPKMRDTSSCVLYWEWVRRQRVLVLPYIFDNCLQLRSNQIIAFSCTDKQMSGVSKWFRINSVLCTNKHFTNTLS